MIAPADSLERLAGLQDALLALGQLADTLDRLAASTQRLPELPEHVRSVDSQVRRGRIGAPRRTMPRTR